MYDRLKILSRQVSADADNLANLESGGHLEERAIHHLNAEIMLELVRRLKPPADSIFLYRYFYDYKVEEIARKLDLSIKKVENILFRYKKRLKKQFEERRLTL